MVTTDVGQVAPLECPRCGLLMRDARVVPQAVTFHELHTLRCAGCGYEMVIEIPRHDDGD